MMVEKFIKDYAEVKKNDILVDDFISEEIREKAIKKIDKTLALRKKRNHHKRWSNFNDFELFWINNKIALDNTIY